jgi:hypothetical protein
MDRMEPIHGKLLADDGIKVLLDPVDGYLGWHPRPQGGKTYFGYFMIPPEKTKSLDEKAAYRLVLDDGRSGEICADVRRCQQPGTLVAEFHVVGNLNR